MSYARRRFATSCAALLLSAAASPAFADEVRDVLVLPDGAVFIALDETPQSLSTRLEPGRLTLDFAGWDAEPRSLAPYGDEVVSRLLVTAQGIAVEGGFTTATVALHTGGVMIRFDTASQPSGPEYSVATAGAAAQTDGELSARSGAASPAAPEAARRPPADGSDGAQSAARSSAASPDPAPEPESSATPARPTPADEPGSRDEYEDAPEVDMQQAPPEAGPCDAQAAALADAPWDLDRITSQADCLVEAGETRNATGLYERVLAFQPEHFQAALGLARLRQQAGRYEDAAQLYETAAGSALTDGQALAARAAAQRAREARED